MCSVHLLQLVARDYKRDPHVRTLIEPLVAFVAVASSLSSLCHCCCNGIVNFDAGKTGRSIRRWMRDYQSHICNVHVHDTHTHRHVPYTRPTPQHATDGWRKRRRRRHRMFTTLRFNTRAPGRLSASPCRCLIPFDPIGCDALRCDAQQHSWIIEPSRLCIYVPEIARRSTMPS